MAVVIAVVLAILVLPEPWGLFAIGLGIVSEGQVKFRGEVWKARSEQPLAAGEPATIKEVDGLVLVVEPERQL